jgi:hypothetical protein
MWLGYNIVNLPYTTWRNDLLEVIANDDSNPLAPIASHLTADWTDSLEQALTLDRFHVQKYSSTKFPCLNRIGTFSRFSSVSMF